MQDLYTTVTNRIITALEQGTPPWICPWQKDTSTVPRNLVSGKPYRGINFIMLRIEAMAATHTDSRWLTFRQANQLSTPWLCLLSQQNITISSRPCVSLMRLSISTPCQIRRTCDCLLSPNFSGFHARPYGVGRRWGRSRRHALPRRQPAGMSEISGTC